MGAVKPDGISNQLLYCTVMIQVQYANGNSGTGTGFIFDPGASTGENVPILITNKHVIEGAQSGIFRVHLGLSENGAPIPSGKHFDVTFTNFAQAWIPHPSDEVDLCGLFVARIFNDMVKNGKSAFYRCLGPSFIPTEEKLLELQALENIVMIGYPIGLWDKENNYPLLRRGVTAYPPSVDFHNRSIGVIDAACFPGSSGSPILIMNEGAYPTRKGLSFGSRVHLLGVLYGGPQYSAEGEIEIVDIPMQQRPWIATQIPCHLGYYVKAREINVLVSHMLSVVGAST